MDLAGTSKLIADQGLVVVFAALAVVIILSTVTQSYFMVRRSDTRLDEMLNRFVNGSPGLKAMQGTLDLASSRLVAAESHLSRIDNRLAALTGRADEPQNGTSQGMAPKETPHA